MPADGQRIRELDLLRGVAIILMVLFHLVYDLNFFYDVPINYRTGAVFYVGKLAASLFIVIAGISSTLSGNNIKRGLYVLFWAFVVTVATTAVIPGSNIVFGILHFLGVSMVIYHFFRRLNPSMLLLLGTLALFLGPAVKTITVPHNLFVPLGLMGKGFFSMDYFPLFPWFGLFLYGCAAGGLMYDKKESIFPLNPTRSNLLDKSGQHSLTIYLAHQPVILSVLYIVFAVL